MHSGILAFILAFGSKDLKTLANHFGKQLLSLYERNLNVAVGVAVKSELTGHSRRKRLISGSTVRSKIAYNPITLILRCDFSKLGCFCCKKIIKFCYKFLHSRNELDKPLRNEDHTIVEPLLGTSHNSISDIIDNLLKSHILGFYLLGDYTYVRLALQCTLKSDMRGRASHELDEVPVFL